MLQSSSRRTRSADSDPVLLCTYMSYDNNKTVARKTNRVRAGTPGWVAAHPGRYVHREILSSVSIHLLLWSRAWFNECWEILPSTLINSNRNIRRLFFSELVLFSNVTICSIGMTEEMFPESVGFFLSVG